MISFLIPLHFPEFFQSTNKFYSFANFKMPKDDALETDQNQFIYLVKWKNGSLPWLQEALCFLSLF